ncbi:MAG: hypothetical protein PT118_01690 [Aphanizomenon gracile PMC644.10]|nr:hypothetical protein [Aphanizomenon gracile PMC644.10]
MTYSNDHSIAYDTNNDGIPDAIVNYSDHDGDHVPHATSAVLDTNYNEIPDTVVELDGMGNILSISIDPNEDGTVNVVTDGSGHVMMADLNSDGISNTNEMSLAQTSINSALSDV